MRIDDRFPFTECSLSLFLVLLQTLDGVVEISTKLH